MRITLVLGLVGATVAAAAVLAAGATGSGSALPPIPKASKAFKVKGIVTIDLVGRWAEWHPPRSDCKAWFLSQGTNKVHTEGVVSGYVSFTSSLLPNRPWAEIGLNGESTDSQSLSFSRRKLKEQSGVDWGLLCVPPRPDPYAIPRNDCEPWDSNKTRPFTVNRPSLAVTASYRKAVGTLEELFGPTLTGRFRVLDVSAFPARKGWYRNCGVRYGPEFPVNLAVLLGDDDVGELKAMKPDRVVKLEYSTRESSDWRQCDEPDNIPPEVVCKGWYKVKIELLRVN